MLTKGTLTKLPFEKIVLETDAPYLHDLKLIKCNCNKTCSMPVVTSWSKSVEFYLCAQIYLTSKTASKLSVLAVASLISTHYVNLPMQYTQNFLALKSKIFN